MKILVVEDEFMHRIDARKFFSGLGREIEVVSASNFHEASSALSDSAHIDGVITDIYFPLCAAERWDQPEPIGIRVALMCEERKIPFVLNTAGYHHLQFSGRIPARLAQGSAAFHSRLR